MRSPTRCPHCTANDWSERNTAIACTRTSRWRTLLLSSSSFPENVANESQGVANLLDESRNFSLVLSSRYNKSLCPCAFIACNLAAC